MSHIVKRKQMTINVQEPNNYGWAVWTMAYVTGQHSGFA
jgi:hypothetical protein